MHDFIQPCEHGHTLAIAAQQPQGIIHRGIDRAIVNGEIEPPQILFLHRSTKVHLCPETYDLHQGLPVPLLIAAAIPAFYIKDLAACRIHEGHPTGLEMSSDSGGRDIKLGAADDLHYLGIFNGQKETPVKTGVACGTAVY